MPTLESIRRFEKALVSLGSEPDVLAERGEEIEEVVPPDETLPPDLHDLLAAEETLPSAEPAARSGAALPPAEPPPERQAPQEPFGTGSLDDLDLEAFGITDEAFDQAAAGKTADEENAPETDAEEFTLPEGLFDTPQEGLEPAPGEEPLAETPQDAEPGLLEESGEQPPQIHQGDVEALPLPDDLLGPEPAEPVEEAVEPLQDIELGESDFELPEDLGAPADETPVEEGAAAELTGEDEGFDASALDLPDLTFEEPSQSADEIAFDESESAHDEAAAEPMPAEEEAVPVAAPPTEPPAQPEDEDFVIDTFGLPGMEAGGIELEEQPAFQQAEGAAPESPPSAYQAEGAKAEYTDEEFEAVREALAGLPLGLRVAVEEQIGARKVTGDDLRRLLDLLIDGASPPEIARALEKIAGVRVPLTRAQKSTGIAFERARGSLGYFLRTRVLPGLRVLVPVAGLLAGLAIAANEYIIRPIEAVGGYRRAVTQIEAAQYEAAAQSFNQAASRHAILRWFHRTAEAYRDKAEYGRAADIYERLLGSRTLVGSDPKLTSNAERRQEIRARSRLRLGAFDRRAVLAYADMRIHETFQYAEAETLLKGYLARTGNQGDYSALIALGDNYIEWGSEQSSKYGDAAKAYGKAMASQRRPTDEPVFRMLRYYARTGDTQQVRRLVLGFEQKRRTRVDAAAYAEAAGALIDASIYDLARQALARAYDTSRDTAEVYYQYGRFFRWAADVAGEERSLDEAIAKFDAAETLRRRLPPRQAKLALLARNALGELHYRSGEPLKAQEVYTAAIERLERQVADKRLKPAPELGRIYANSGDVHYYYDRDLTRALALYEKARAMGAAGEEIGYKIGYIHYDREDLGPALAELHRVVQVRRDNPSALYALANTLYLRGDYFAAQGYYNQLLKQLESRRQRQPPGSPQEDSALQRLMEITMRTYNNLGVNEKKLSMDSRNPNRESRALFYLSRSIEFHDQMMRDPNTLARSEARNLGFLNSRAIMYPRAGIELEIYREIPVDLESYRM